MKAAGLTLEPNPSRLTGRVGSSLEEAAWAPVRHLSLWIFVWMDFAEWEVAMGRSLYVVFISSHVDGEQGVNSPKLLATQKRTRSRKAFARNQTAMRRRWSYIERRLGELIPDFSDVVLYQDSFVAAAPEVVEQHFERISESYPRSPNFLLLRKLMDRGAYLYGVDDLGLIVQHLAIMQRLSSVTKEELRDNWQELLVLKATEDDLVNDRNRSIAHRIVRTLHEGGIGVLFLGRDHRSILTLLEEGLGKEHVHVVVR